MEISNERRCPNCGCELSPGQLFCAKCGSKVEIQDTPVTTGDNKKKGPPVVIIIVAAAILIAIAGIVTAIVISNNSSGKAEATETTETTPEPTPTPSPTPTSSPTPTPSPTPDPTKKLYYVGDVVDVYTQGIELFQTGEITDGDDRCIVAIFGIVNGSSETIFVSSFDFDCYADGVACSSHYLWGWDTGSLDELSATISPGNGAVGYVCFEVPDDAEEIIIEYEYDWLHGKRLKFVYEGDKTADNWGE